ncbi:MAG: hypothetical protein CVU34_11930 [Betaproteobacteria bacterium HGW-Betaproteobacteria-7]|jgi:hypothetical protein|nr:MAG: hypothetical protein CVU34_11930 [Betaproteobacteria bacterium HGW-Betaproteobacteria-7]
MKAFVFLLILGNLLFYAYAEGYLGQPENPDAARVTNQIQPERIRIVSRDREPPLSGTAGEQESAPAASEPVVLQPAGELAGNGEGKVCLAWNNLSASDADRLTSLVTSRFPDFRINRRLEAGESGGWWIYITPQATKAEAEKKAAELRQLGVTDYFIIQDGPNRFAISLGVFSAEKGGADRLAELRAKGVRSARLMPRPGKDGTISLQGEGPAAGQAALIAALNGNLAKPAARDCP